MLLPEDHLLLRVLFAHVGVEEVWEQCSQLDHFLLLCQELNRVSLLASFRIEGRGVILNEEVLQLLGFALLHLEVANFLHQVLDLLLNVLFLLLKGLLPVWVLSVFDGVVDTRKLMTQLLEFLLLRLEFLAL